MRTILYGIFFRTCINSIWSSSFPKSLIEPWWYYLEVMLWINYQWISSMITSSPKWSSVGLPINAGCSKQSFLENWSVNYIKHFVNPFRRSSSQNIENNFLDPWAQFWVDPLNGSQVCYGAISRKYLECP
jgi:hypothetical protein